MFSIVDPKHLSFLLLLVGGILLTIGDIILKKWAINNSIALYISGIAVWLLALNALAYTFKFKNIATASMLLVIFNIICLYLVSILYFKEQLTLKGCLGLLLGLIATSLLESE